MNTDTYQGWISVTQTSATGRFCVQAVGILFVAAQRTRMFNHIEPGDKHGNDVMYLSAVTIIWRKAVL